MDSSMVMNIALVAVVLAVVWMMFGRGGGDPEAVRAALDRGALVLDVRSGGEFAGGHVEGAVNVPVGELGGRVEDLAPRDRAIVVYCASGARSARAASMLRGAGYQDVHDAGGIRAMRAMLTARQASEGS